MKKTQRSSAFAASACAVVVGLILLPAGAHEVDPPPDDPPAGDLSLSHIACENGFADIFPCDNVDLEAFIPMADFGAGQLNDIWGWTDSSTGTEYALVGFDDGVGFIDLSDPHAPLYLGLLPSHTSASIWNDVKVYGDHAFIVSEAPGHGMQVFDLTQLANVVAPPVTFGETTHYAGFGDAHNIAINEETAYAYVVGANSCSGGLHMIDVAVPASPVFAGCFSGDGYTHDARCVIYAGGDIAHQGSEICFNANEDTLTIVDVTDKSTPVMLSATSYAGVGYSHQGWLTEDHEFFLLGDELDELDFGHGTRTWVWDVSDLDAPALAGHHEAPQQAIDHNMYGIGDHVFQANYRSGLRVLRMGDLGLAELTEVAFFDTVPGDDDAGFSGTWGVYPFFASGIVVMSDIYGGFFVLEPDPAAVPRCADGIDNDGDGRFDFDGGASVNGGVPLGPADPQCVAASTPFEFNRSKGCGLGAEAIPLLILLVRRRGARAGRRAGPLCAARWLVR